MKHPLRAAALAAGALLCLSASQAFADLEFITAEDGGSWFASYRLGTGAFHTYDEIRINIDHSLVMFNRGTTGQDLNGDGYDDGTASDFNTPAFVESGNRDFAYESPGNHPAGPATVWHQFGPNTGSDATAKGDVTDNMRFWMHLGTGPFGFPQTRAAGVRFTLDAYRGGIHVATGQAYAKLQTRADGTTFVDEFSSLTLMPVPAALWTGLPMLGGVILLVRRNKRRTLS